MKKKIIVRADGNSKIGIGHITRCIYFIENIKGISDIVYCFTKNSLIKEFLISRDYSTYEIEPNLLIEQEMNRLLSLSPDLLILDIRDKPNEYYKSFSKNFEKVLRFDDSSKSISIYSNFYLNYNLYAEEIKFNLNNSNCELFLGPEYYILNPIFKKYENYERIFKKRARNILLTMGGGDPKDLTVKILNSIIEIKDIHINTILGKLYSKVNEIKILKRNSPDKLSIFYDVNNMPEMMAKNDLIITTGGNTSFEAAYMGIPGVLINQIELQALNAEKYQQKKIFKSGALGEKLNEETIRDLVEDIIESQQVRKELSENGRKLLKSEGIIKVIEKIMN